MIIARRNDRGARVFGGCLMLLIGFTAAAHSTVTPGWFFVLVFLFLGVPLIFVGERVELDFARKRYRVYSVPFFSFTAPFKELPEHLHIHVRDIAFQGGRVGSRFSWGDTYAYEVSLMTPSRNKLVVCIRSSEHLVRRAVGQLAQLSGLPVVDLTGEKVVSSAAN